MIIYWYVLITTFYKVIHRWWFCPKDSQRSRGEARSLAQGENEAICGQHGILHYNTHFQHLHQKKINIYWREEGKATTLSVKVRAEEAFTYGC